MGCTVAELEQKLSSREYGEWVEFFHLEPFGWEAQCYTSGIVAATIANVNRDTKKKRTPFEAIDFVPGAKRSPKKIDAKELKAKLQVAYAGLLHGRDGNIQNNRARQARTKTKGTRPSRRNKDRG